MHFLKSKSYTKSKHNKKITKGQNEKMYILTQKVHYTPLLLFFVNWTLQSPKKFMNNIKSDNEKKKLENFAKYIPNQESKAL